MWSSSWVDILRASTMNLLNVSVIKYSDSQRTMDIADWLNYSQYAVFYSLMFNLKNRLNCL